ncbi:MAG: RNA polymerase sigma factor RpoE [Gammaproteobacteria bacterium]|nr:RNA polymerase sigma factor RpoE [Gammaproteobacteria bacterium]MCF6230547.1 RNA polymerase sigma factor RpoE [Gammaproteobacteria bacterium]
MGENFTDRELVKRVQNGDKTAFDLLVLKYQHKIIKLVSRFVREPSDALDVTQDSFIKAYRALPNFRGESAFYTWLYRIASNTAKNFLVSQRRRLGDVGIDSEEMMSREEEFGLNDVATPENILAKDEVQHTVFETIENLPDDLRTALTLREFDGLSYDEIAEVMECPVGTVRSRIFRARETVSEKLRALSGE